MVRLTSVDQEPLVLNEQWIVAVWRNGYNGSRVRTRDGQIFDAADSVDTIWDKIAAATKEVS